MTDILDRQDKPHWRGDARPMRHRRPLAWEAIVAGVLMALSVQVVLGLFGTAIGLSTVNVANPDAAPTAHSAGVGSAMWGAVSIVVALFYGGFIAARLSMSPCRHEGVLRGLVVWAAATITIVCLLSSSLGGLLSGAAHVMKGATSTVSAGAGAAASGQLPDLANRGSDALSRQADDLIRGNGTTATPTTPDQVKADMVVQFGILTSDGTDAAAARQRLVTDLETQGVAPAEAQARIAGWEAKMQVEKQKAKVAADKLAHDTAKAAAAAGVLLVLSALTAALGGALGAAHIQARRKHEHADHRDGVRP